jgi:signal peptidase II
MVVLQTMYVGQSIPLLGDWLKFTFTENPGMAFGINFGPRGFVTILSITATILIFFYLYNVRKSFAWYRVSIAFILGGALGNIIDRVFYGFFFNGDPLFTGKVVDFIHVNLWRGYLPDAWPFVGGKYAALFPIWNVADMAIVVGVVGILLFQNRFQESIKPSEANSDLGPADTAPDTSLDGIDPPASSEQPPSADPDSGPNAVEEASSTPSLGGKTSMGE